MFLGDFELLVHIFFVFKCGCAFGSLVTCSLIILLWRGSIFLELLPVCACFIVSHIVNVYLHMFKNINLYFKRYVCMCLLLQIGIR